LTSASILASTSISTSTLTSIDKLVTECYNILLIIINLKQYRHRYYEHMKTTPISVLNPNKLGYPVFSTTSTSTSTGTTSYGYESEYNVIEYSKDKCAIINQLSPIAVKAGLKTQYDKIIQSAEKSIHSTIVTLTNAVSTLYYTVLYCALLYYTVLYCAILCYTVLYYVFAFLYIGSVLFLAFTLTAIPSQFSITINHIVKLK
jgi:hypothetical protein